MNYRAEIFLVAEGSLDAVVVALGVERNSLTESPAARDTELGRLQPAVNAMSDFVELLKNFLHHQITSFEKAKAVLEAQKAGAKKQPDDAPTERTNRMERLHDEIVRLSSDQSVLSVELKATRR